MGWIVVNKSTLRVHFATQTQDVRVLGSLYSPSLFTYEEWNVPNAVVLEPWHFFRFPAGLRRERTSDSGAVAAAADRAELLLLMNKAIISQLRLIRLSQEEALTYSKKISEAVEVANGVTGDYPLLRADAEQQGKTEFQVAQALLLRHAQCRTMKLDVQEFRERTTFQILHYPLHELKPVKDKLNAYLA